MSHRLERLGSLVRQIVSEAIMTRVSDPRVSRFTTITRVDVSADLSFADVYISTLGDAGAQRTSLRGLQSARGLIQSIVARELATRTCPTLRFHEDDSIKRGIETIRAIEQLAAERPPGESRAEDGNESGGEDHEESR